jgi:hypothetical protein
MTGLCPDLGLGLACSARQSCLWPDPLPGLVLAEPLTEEVRCITKTYTVPMIVNGAPLDSGTLVQIDNHFGILSAGHVVNHPRRRELQLTYAGCPERILLTSIAKFAHSRSISTNLLGVVKANRSSNAYRPDLAFFEAPKAAMLAELRAKKRGCGLTNYRGPQQQESLGEAVSE